MDMHVQDLVEALSDPKAWNTPRKVDQSTFERKADGTFAGAAHQQQPSSACAWCCHCCWPKSTVPQHNPACCQRLSHTL